MLIIINCSYYCTLYFRSSVKSASFTCEWDNSDTDMGSSYLTRHFTTCTGNSCHDAQKNYYIYMTNWYKMKRRILIDSKSGPNFASWTAKMDHPRIGFGERLF